MKNEQESKRPCLRVEMEECSRQSRTSQRSGGRDNILCPGTEGTQRVGPANEKEWGHGTGVGGSTWCLCTVCTHMCVPRSLSHS